MTTPPKKAETPRTSQGTKEEWKNLPKRRCDNCGKKYKPSRPTSRFCKPECKASYHRHGGAYMKLKGAIEKEIHRQMNLTETCPACKGTGLERKAKCTNEDCIGGRQLTNYGKATVQSLTAFLRVDLRPFPGTITDGILGTLVTAADVHRIIGRLPA
jgi:excinuclease UvrABC ATPase subunit